MLIYALPRFKALAKAGSTVPADALLRKDFVSTVEDLDDRRVRFIVSTGAVDRDGDTVAVDGWALDEFKANPIVLWAHDAYNLPIGRCTEIGSDGAALKATVEFLPADMPVRGPLAEAVLRMCRTGFLSATSVGFKPISYEIAKERMDDDAWFAPLDFTRQTLMEFLVVAIPSNAEALIEPGERQGLIVPPTAPVVELNAAVEAAKAAEAGRIVATARAERQRRARTIAYA